MWQVGDQRYWVDEDGELHPAEGGNDPGILVKDTRPEPPAQVDVSAVTAARQLAVLVPDLRMVEYTPGIGLRFTHPRGWAVYLGTGTDMAQKVGVLKALEAQFAGEGKAQPALLDLRFPSSPYYRFADGAREGSMWLPLIGLLLGVILGSIFSISIPAEYTRYTAVAILAALDSVLGAVRADMEDQYDNLVFVSGFLVNAILAVLLTLLGDRLGVELYTAAVVAFGVRMFYNLAIIRRLLLNRVRSWWRKRQVTP